MDFELAAALRAASLTVHACRKTTVDAWGDEVTMERHEQRDRESPRDKVAETCLDVAVTKVVRGVLSVPASPR
jgi:hypothetical protein